MIEKAVEEVADHFHQCFLLKVHYHPCNANISALQ